MRAAGRQLCVLQCGSFSPPVTCGGKCSRWSRSSRSSTDWRSPRREAGAAGKDTRGLFRVHQFDKVEMFSFVEPAQSEAEHERILAIEEEIMQALEIPYRVVNIAAWDLGASAAKKYDVEAWLPGQERYRELTSCSNTTDYQARRLSVRYRPSEESSPRFVHTLNGTAVAVGRTIIAIVENGQRDDGSIAIPESLHPYGAPPEIAAAN